MSRVKIQNLLISIQISRNIFFPNFLTLKFGVSRTWPIALFCDLAKELLPIFFRNDLQRFNVCKAQSSCSFTSYLALVISSTETKAQYLSVMFLMLKTQSYCIADNFILKSLFSLAKTEKVFKRHNVITNSYHTQQSFWQTQCFFLYVQKLQYVQRHEP